MEIFLEELGQFGLPAQNEWDYHLGSIGKIWMTRHSILCSECGEPMIKGDLIIYENWTEGGQTFVKYYHEPHASEELRQEYAGWLSDNAPVRQSSS